MNRVHTTLNLSVGDEITLASAGFPDPIRMTVHSINDDPSKATHNARTVYAWTRPGGVGISFDDSHLSSGNVRVERYRKTLSDPEEVTP